jgi:hypothetical protein
MEGQKRSTVARQKHASLYAAALAQIPVLDICPEKSRLLDAYQVSSSPPVLNISHKPSHVKYQTVRSRLDSAALATCHSCSTHLPTPSHCSEQSKERGVVYFSWTLRYDPSYLSKRSAGDIWQQRRLQIPKRRNDWVTFLSLLG